MTLSKEFIKQNWPLTNVSLNKINIQGKGGEVGIVVSDQGKYVYKIAGSWKTASKLEQDLDLFDFFNNQYSFAPRLLRTKESHKFVNINSKLVYLISYIEGEAPKLSNSNYFLLGQTLAEIHQVKDFPF